MSPVKTRRIDVDANKEVHARCGVKELRIIDPEPQRIGVFELGQSVGAPARGSGADASLTTLLRPCLGVAAARVFAR